MEIICPHCGVSQSIDSNKEQAFCTFCGSSLTEILLDLKRNEHKRPEPAEMYNSQPTATPKIFPFTDYQGIPSLPRSINLSSSPQTSPPITPEVEPFPFSKESSQPVDQTTFPSPHQPSAVKLKFPQIHQEAHIPYIPAIFHFGRNVILPLVSPDKFDVSWLNSISRVRKQNNIIIHQHFTIMRANNGKYYIEDKFSRWGTYLNQTQIKGKGKIELHNGDKIELMLSKPNVKQIVPFVIIFECF